MVNSGQIFRKSKHHPPVIIWAFFSILFVTGCSGYVRAKLVVLGPGGAKRPALEIFTSPAEGETIKTNSLSSMVVSGKCERVGEIVEVSVKGRSPTSLTCTSLVWSVTVDASSLDEGQHEIRAVFKNKSGVAKYHSTIVFIKDTTPPKVSFEIPVDPAVVRGETIPLSIIGDGTGSNIASRFYALALDGVTFEDFKPVTSDEFMVSIPSSASSSQNAKIKLRVLDDAGNVSETTSGPIHVMANVNKLTGTYANASGSSFGAPDDARLLGPESITKDSQYIYVHENCLIRRVRISDGVSDRLAGKAILCEPVDGKEGSIGSIGSMAVYGDWIYFTDTDNHLFRRVNKNSAGSDYGLIETVAGAENIAGGTDDFGLDARFHGPKGLAITGNFAYVSDRTGELLRRIDLTNSQVTTLVGAYGVTGNSNGTGTAARLNGPSVIAFDGGAFSGASGSIYIWEVTHRVRRFDIATGAVTSFIGTLLQPGSLDGTGGAVKLRFPGGLISDGTYLYLSDQVHHVIRRAHLNTAVVETIAGVAGHPEFQDGSSSSPFAKFSKPSAMVIEGGSLYIADQGNHVIRKMDTTTPYAVSRWIGFPYGSNSRFDPVNSNEAGAGALGEFSQGIATFDGDTVYYGSSHANTIRKLVVSANTSETIAGTIGQSTVTNNVNGTLARFVHPYGMTLIDSNSDGVQDRLYISDQYAHLIREMNLTTTEVRTIAGDGTAASTDNVVGLSARFNGPGPIAKCLDNSCIYVAEINGRRIRKIDFSVVNNPVTTIAGDGTIGLVDNAIGTSANFTTIRGLVVVGNFLYVTDANTLRKIDLVAGGFPVTTIAGASAAGSVDGEGVAARFSAPTGLAAFGNIIYIGDRNNDLIRTFNITTSVVGRIVGEQSLGSRNLNGIGLSAAIDFPRALAISDSGQTLYVSFGTTSISGLVRIDLASGQSTSLMNSGFISRNNSEHVPGARDGALVPVDAQHRSLACVAREGSLIYGIERSGGIYSYNLNMTGEVLLAGSTNNPGHLDGVGTAARLSRTAVGGCAISNGHLYFSQAVTNTIRRMNLSTREVSTIAGSPTSKFGTVDGVGSAARLNLPGPINILGDDLYVVDDRGTILRKMNIKTLGALTTVAGDPNISGTVDGTGTAARLEGVIGIAKVGSTFYLASESRSSAGKFVGTTIRRFNPSTNEVTTIIGSATARGEVDGIGLSARLLSPSSLTSDGVNLWLTDDILYKTLKIRPSTLEVKTLIGNGNLREDLFGPIENTSNIGNAIHWIEGVGLVLPRNFESAVYQ